jgi:hypothetical protein
MIAAVENLPITRPKVHNMIVGARVIYAEGAERDVAVMYRVNRDLAPFEIFTLYY